MNGSIILRHKLMDILDKLAGERMIYVCAPAGYGKTVTVQQWLTRDGGRSAVMTLDEHDNDLSHFCLWFCVALRECQPENTALSEILAHPAFHSAPSQFAARAIAALTDAEQARFVIDDLHFVHDKEVLRLLLSFLKRLPACFHIVLVSRNELPPDFSELLVKGRLSCVTANDLRFSREEIALLYKKNGVSITPKQAEQILRFTDGWAIGIGAVLLSGGDPDGESLKHLEKFIKTHVWERWDEQAREFLIKTSVVQEMTPALCTTLTDVEDSKRLLDELVRQNAFISRERNGVYRYHRLFRACLTHILEERGGEFSRALLKKAGDWYLSERDFFSAVECFIKCEDKDGLIRCFNFLDISGYGYAIPERLLPIIGAEIIPALANVSPHIYSSLTWASFNQGRAADLARYADLYYSHIPEILNSDPRLAYYIVFMRLIDFRFTLPELIHSLGELPFNTASEQSGAVQPELGIINQNMPMLHRGTRDFSECAAGDAERNIAEVKDALGGLFGGEIGLLAEAVTAGLLYEQGHLDKALSHALAANAEIREDFAPETKFCAMAILACVMGALDQPEQVGAVLTRIGNMIEQDKAYYLNYNFNALSTRFGLVKGDTKAARAWLEENEPPLNNSVDFYKLYGHFTTCGAYIAVGNYDSAIIMLRKVLALVTEYNRPMDIIEARVMLSIACWKKKRTSQSEAILHLEQAVLMAYRYGYTQVFVEMGAELSGMLHRLQNRVEQRIGDNSPPASFVKILYMKAAEHTSAGLTSGQLVKTASYTDKQQAVMRLMCEGKSYRDMTEILGIKLPSLRSHISLIYKKLDVTNEADAIKKINALDILDEHQ